MIERAVQKVRVIVKTRQLMRRDQLTQRRERRKIHAAFAIALIADADITDMARFTHVDFKRERIMREQAHRTILRCVFHNDALTFKRIAARRNFFADRAQVSRIRVKNFIKLPRDDRLHLLKIEVHDAPPHDIFWFRYSIRQRIPSQLHSTAQIIC